MGGRIIVSAREGTMSDDILERAISLVHEGKVQEAHELLDSLINAEVHNVQAWLWYAKTCASPAERQEALQAGLSYNPDDPTLQQILGKAPGASRPEQPRATTPARSTSLQDPSIVNAIQASRAAGVAKQQVEAPSKPRAVIPTWAMLGSGVLLVAFIGIFAWIALKPRPQPLDPAQYRHSGVVEYYLYIPQNYTPDRSWPLFVGIHGFGGSGLDCWNWWQSYADREGFILLCPSLGDMDGGWYQDAGEAKLFSALNEVRADYRIGPREFLAGFSAGAEFAQ